MLSPKKILVVDDDLSIHRLLETVLASPDLEMEHASDGAEGLERILTRHYDLVLTDVHMPGLDGLELLRTVKRERPATKVVVMTGDNTTDKMLDSLRDHAFGYFSKPFSPATVTEVVAQALSADTEGDIQVSSASPGWIALEVSCRLDVADRLVQFLSQMKTDIPAKEREDVAFAFREMLRNAIEHGGKCDPAKRVHVAYIRTDRIILYYIRDPGEGFRFDSLPHAAVSYPENQPAEHIMYRLEHGLRPGGFGILMARHMLDELIYNEQGNELVLIKYL
ncbi:MAG: response regulator [Bryobacteraceae bacterium]|nr:response regulator [Bryobacteraceae bacterium]